MFSEERYQKILDIMKRDKRVTVNGLSEELYSSLATIRRDLTALEREGIIKRFRGGAVLIENLGEETSYRVRSERNNAEKNLMASYIADLIPDAQTLFLDASSTVAHVIPHLRERVGIFAITVGVENALNLATLTSARVFVPGGILSPNTQALEGSECTQRLAELHADYAVLSCSGISMQGIVGEISLEHSAIKRIMIRNSRHRILLCDHTKFANPFNSDTCHIKEFDWFITDRYPPLHIVRMLESNDVRLICPGNPPPREDP